MIYGATTSIRLPLKLRDQLENTAYTLHKGKNWIITRALEEYLAKFDRAELSKEARRQSLLASKAAHKEDIAWEESADGSEWI